MSPSFTPPSGPCLETSGFLFSHDCPRSASGMCMQCGKLICESHSHANEEGIVCSTCAKQLHSEEDEGVDSESTDREEDPYLYSSYHYEGYGYYGRGHWGHEELNDPNDFTEADGESLRAEYDEDFEESMGGS